MIPAFITTLGGYHLTLSIPWLKHHDVKIDFASNFLTLESEYCLKNCVNDVTMAYEIEEELPHFLRAYAAQCALGHKVLEKDKVLQILPKQYHELLPLFLEKTEDQLPPHGRFDHEIPQRLGFIHPFGPIYGVHQKKLILRLRGGRRVRTHRTSFFRPLGPQRPDAIPNADCVLT